MSISVALQTNMPFSPSFPSVSDSLTWSRHSLVVLSISTWVCTVCAPCEVYSRLAPSESYLRHVPSAPGQSEPFETFQAFTLRDSSVSGIVIVPTLVRESERTWRGVSFWICDCAPRRRTAEAGHFDVSESYHGVPLRRKFLGLLPPKCRSHGEARSVNDEKVPLVGLPPTSIGRDHTHVLDIVHDDQNVCRSISREAACASSTHRTSHPQPSQEAWRGA